MGSPTLRQTSSFRNFEDAAEYLKKREKKKLCRNTWLVRNSDNEIAVRLHNTDIIRFQKVSDKMVLNANKYMTPTTKDRINRFQNRVSISQDKRQWTVTTSKEQVIFENYMKIDSEGNVEGVSEYDPKLLDKIKKYVKGYMKALVTGKIKSPGTGDCFLCQSINGDGRVDAEHYLSHMQENYYVPSMIVNAIQEIKVSPVAQSYLYEIFNGGKVEKFYEGIAQEQLSKSLLRFLCGNLGLAR